MTDIQQVKREIFDRFGADPSFVSVGSKTQGGDQVIVLAVTDLLAGFISRVESMAYPYSVEVVERGPAEAHR